MSISVMTKVWADAPVSGNKLLILLALADWCNDQNECWPAYDTLARKTRINKSTAIRNVKSLEEMGLIRVSRNLGRSNQNVYILCLDAMTDTKGGNLQPPAQKVANDAERVANDPVKGGTVAIQTVREPLEPSVKRKTRIPDDAVISDLQIDIAKDLGYSHDEALAQFSRFKDGALANGRLYVNWDAAWRSWFNSPYFKEITNGGSNGRYSNPQQRNGASQGGERVDPALAQIARLAGLS